MASTLAVEEYMEHNNVSKKGRLTLFGTKKRKIVSEKSAYGIERRSAKKTEETDNNNVCPQQQ
eukprot:7081710-Ditylum_brightwellii.AAC.1